MPSGISGAALPIAVSLLRPSGRKIDVTSYRPASSRIVAESSRQFGLEPLPCPLLGAKPPDNSERGGVLFLL